MNRACQESREGDNGIGTHEICAQDPNLEVSGVLHRYITSDMLNTLIQP